MKSLPCRIFLFFALSIEASSAQEWNKQSLREITHPHPIEKLFPEWSPAEALFLSVPMDIVRKYPERRTYFMDIIKVVAPHLDVVILYDEDKEADLNFWIRALKDDPEINPYRKERLHYVPSRVQSEWLRDFGPFFGRSEEGSLLVFDQRYQGLEYLKTLWSLERKNLFESGNRELEQERERSQLMNFFDDITPSFIANYIKRRSLRSVELVRPPVALAGGDFATDGEGRIFITEDTLIENGGSKAALFEIFQKYYGAKELHVLFANPGRTTRHLDMSFRLVNPNLALLVELPENQPALTSHQRRILREIASTQAANRAYLEKHLPHIEILSLPMPPLLFKKRSEMEREIQEQVMQEVGNLSGLDMDRVNAAGSDSALYREAAAIIRNQLRRDLNWDPAKGPFDLKQAVQFYFEEDLEDRISAFTEERILYRTYANSLHLNLENRPDLVLIPSYDLQREEYAGIFDGLEDRVAEVYKKAYPGAELHFINSDAVITLMGAVHCTTLALPVW